MKRFIKPAFAHCDGPCGHYETDTLRNSALTCRKLVDKIAALGENPAGAELQQLIRLTKIKDDHALICKTQVYILWSDYFKPAHYERYPRLAQQLYQLAQTCSQVRQTAGVAPVEALLDQVAGLEKIFQETQTT